MSESLHTPREENLINRSRGVHMLLKGLAPVMGLMPKRLYCFRYYHKSGKKLNLKHPDELQGWIMANYYRDLKDPQKRETLARLTDKLAVREFVKERVGDKYLTKLYGRWRKVKDVDIDALPGDCVIKTNNGCGTNFILRSRQPRDKKAIREKLSDWMSYPFGKLSGQPHYNYIIPEILAEEYLVQAPGDDSLPYDYKFYCFNGVPQFLVVFTGRSFSSHKTNNYVFTPDWEWIPDGARVTPEGMVDKPVNYGEMLEVVRKLAAGFEFVRVDLYSVGRRIVFGEMTFTPDVYMPLSDALLSRSVPTRR